MNAQQMLIELRALELFRSHYERRPWITERDYSSIEFYRRYAEAEAAGALNHEALRKEYGGSFQ